MRYGNQRILERPSRISHLCDCPPGCGFPLFCGRAEGEADHLCSFAVNMDTCGNDIDDVIDDSAPQEYIASETDPTLEPYEGMEFESEEAARAYYDAYATRTGFRVRISSFIRSKRDKTIISRQLVCSKEGFRSNKDSHSVGMIKHPRMITRVGCRAMIMVKKQNSGKWVISKCEKVHNHVLGTQGKVILLDFDPYARAYQEVVVNPLEVASHGDVLSESPHEMVIFPPEVDPSIEPCLGMEFESENNAQVFYKAYARRVGFNARVSSYYRSKCDNSIISRLIVCSKEGFRAKRDRCAEERLQRLRTITRVGCKAMIMVKKRDSGKWVVSKLVKHHNHTLTTKTTSDEEESKNEDGELNEVERTFYTGDGDTILQPYEGMEFESEDAAKAFYCAYSKHVGFNMRVSTYYRSKRDKSVISRLFVCSKEGFYVKKDVGSEDKIMRPQEATRVGCKAMLMVKRNHHGRWVVSKFQKDHNHGLGTLKKFLRLNKRKHLTGTGNSADNHIKSKNGNRESPSSQYNHLCREEKKNAEVGATSLDCYNEAIHALRNAAGKVTALKTDRGSNELGAVVDGDHQDGLSGKTSSFQQQEIIRYGPVKAQSEVFFWQEKAQSEGFFWQEKAQSEVIYEVAMKAQSEVIYDKMPQNTRICITCNQPADHDCCCLVKQQMVVVDEKSV